MSLFSGIPPDRGASTVVEAAKRVEETLSQLPRLGPHSLCEIRPTNADYDWLCEWAAHLTYEVVIFRQWRVGALALLLAAEAARREADEGHVWPVMRNRFRGETQEVFFELGQ